MSRYYGNTKAIILDAATQKRLAMKAKRGDLIAQDTLVQSCMGLVVQIANMQSKGIHPVQDLINDGVIGLIKSIRTYSPSRGAFSTHAFINIKGYIKECISNNSRLVRIPRNVQYIIEKYITGKIPKLPDYIDPKDYEAIMNNYEHKAYTALDNQNEEFTNSIAVPDGLGKIEHDDTRRELICHLRKVLPKPLSIVIMLKYGFLDTEPQTIDSIAKIMGYTPNEIRDILKMAMDILKSDSYMVGFVNAII